MAEGILFDVVVEIIKTLGSEAIQEIALCSGAKDELNKMENTVSSIKAVLLDAEHQSAVNNQVKDWLGKLKEVVYDAEDLVDDFSTEALSRRLMSGSRIKKEVRLFFSRSNQLVYGLKMGRKARAVRERLDAISADRRNFNFEERLISSDGTHNYFMGKGRGREESFVVEEDVIGREDDKSAILERLVDDGDKDEDVCVIPIVGIGGLGKTTLARLVYNSPEVDNQFAEKMWVCVSEPFEVQRILKEAITYGGGARSELQRQFLNKFGGKKYLFVLDDVWNEDPLQWYDLEETLRCGARGSRVIVTTRSLKVAKICSRLKPHILKGLYFDKAWDLFIRIVSHHQELKTPEAVYIGKEILEKCKGVPLAIKTIASLLWLKDPETQWQPFMENEFSKLDHQSEKGILPTLKLSYDHLPSHLKQCFAYCRLFPKDFWIDVQKLVHQWIAHGFVVISSSSHSPSQSQNLEELGMEYFMELWQMSFFQEVRDDRLFVKGKACNMHDLMHDLAVSVAGSESSIIDMEDDDCNIDEKIRHVSFPFQRYSAQYVLDSLNDSKRLRTILMLQNPPWTYNRKEVGNIEAIYSKWRHLRVLDLCFIKCDIERSWDSIGKLKHLRYLDLSLNSRIEVLPSSITRLVNLQVLNLNGCFDLKQLPAYVKKLVNLRHLCIEYCWGLRHMPRGIGELTSLQTLSMFVVAKEEDNCIGGLDELHGLNNLRGKLKIINLKYVRTYAGLRKAQDANLKAKQHLQELSLSWDRSDGEEEDGNCDDGRCLEMLQPHHNLKGFVLTRYGGVIFPSWISSLINLVDLTLIQCTRICHLPTLDQFPALQNLSVYSATNLKYIEDCHGKSIGERVASPLNSLKRIVLEGCPNLEGWWKKEEEKMIDEDDKSVVVTDEQLPQFSCLSILSIRDCPKLTWMPLFPALDDHLHLVGSSIELLRQTLMMIDPSPPPSLSTASSSTTFVHPPLSKLDHLTLGSIDDLHVFPEEWLQKLTSLRGLWISKCPNLISVPLGIAHHTSLQRVTIRDCPQLRDADGNTIHIENW